MHCNEIKHEILLHDDELDWLHEIMHDACHGSIPYSSDSSTRKYKYNIGGGGIQMYIMYNL